MHGASLVSLLLSWQHTAFHAADRLFAMAVSAPYHWTASSGGGGSGVFVCVGLGSGSFIVCMDTLGIYYI